MVLSPEIWLTVAKMPFGELGEDFEKDLGQKRSILSLAKVHSQKKDLPVGVGTALEFTITVLETTPSS